MDCCNNPAYYKKHIFSSQEIQICSWRYMVQAINLFKCKWAHSKYHYIQWPTRPIIITSQWKSPTGHLLLMCEEMPWARIQTSFPTGVATCHHKQTRPISEHTADVVGNPALLIRWLGRFYVKADSSTVLLLPLRGPIWKRLLTSVSYGCMEQQWWAISLWKYLYSSRLAQDNTALYKCAQTWNIILFRAQCTWPSTMSRALYNQIL